MLALMEPFQTVHPPTVLPPGRIEDLPHGIAHVPDFVQCVDTPKKGAKVTSGAQLVILGFIGSVSPYLEHYWRPLKPRRMRRVLPMSHRKCFRDAAHNAISPPVSEITTHSKSRTQLKSLNCNLRRTAPKTQVVPSDQGVAPPPPPRPQHGPFRSPTGTTTTKRLSHADRAASSLLARLTRAPVLSDSLGSVRNPQSCKLYPLPNKDVQRA
ncbi:hypothetical protein J6590_089489 [Homalodisca vitripennis]|nr:hypothetical protein J6590_089489 [Homalodisca vitripennis]